LQRIHFLGAGGNEVLDLELLPDPRPGDEQVLVKVRYAGLNPLDVIQRNGKYPIPEGASPYHPGVEVAGTVIAVGAKVRRWAEGDRVMGLVSEAALADRVLAQQDHLLAVPDAISDSAAATLPEAIMTGFDALDRARTQLGDRVVIRGVNGGVGLATYQIASAMGAVPMGIVRSGQTAKNLDSMGVNTVLEGDFAAEVRERKGADVIIELVGGAYIADDLRVVASGGRIVVVSVAGGNEATIPTDHLLGKRVDLMGTVLRPRTNGEKALLISAVQQRVLPLIANGQLRIPVEEVFPIKNVADAFDHLEKPGKIGKVLLDFGNAI
jgi:NADPH2:quinone reductase